MNEIIRGMPFEEYLAAPGVDKTALWPIIAQSPAHYRYEREHPKVPAAVMEFGTAFHAYLFEREAFVERYTVSDGPVNEKTGKPYGTDTKAFEAWRAEHPGPVVSTADMVRMKAMAEQILYDETIRGFLEMPAESELSMFWTDPETGIACKGRVDRLIQGVQIMDLKTCESAKPEVVKRAADRYGYWFQMAFYRWGLGILAPGRKPLLPLLLASESEPPHKASLCRLTDTACDEGERQYRSALRRLAECERMGRWPGYEGVYDIEPSKYVRDTIFD